MRRPKPQTSPARCFDQRVTSMALEAENFDDTQSERFCTVTFKVEQYRFSSLQGWKGARINPSKRGQVGRWVNGRKVASAKQMKH